MTDLIPSPYGKIISTIVDLLKHQKEDEWHGTVLEHFEEVEQGIKKLEGLIALVLDYENFILLQRALDGAVSDINSWYEGDASNISVQGWLANKQPDLKNPGDKAIFDAVARDVSENGVKLLRKIHLAVLGSLDRAIPDWMTIYHSFLTDGGEKNNVAIQATNITLIENLYMYFAYLVQLQMKCYAAICWAGLDEVAQTLGDTLGQNIHLQGAYVQKKVDVWANTTSIPETNDPYYYLTPQPVQRGGGLDLNSQVYIDCWPDIPAGHVVYDYGVITVDAKDDLLALKVNYGKLQPNGYVTPVGSIICDNGSIFYMLFRGGSDPLVNPVAAGTFFTSPSPRHVVVNVKLTSIPYEDRTEGERKALALVVLVSEVLPSGELSNETQQYYFTDASNSGVKLLTFDNRDSILFQAPMSEAEISDKSAFVPLNNLQWLDVTKLPNGVNVTNLNRQNFHENAYSHY